MSETNSHKFACEQEMLETRLQFYLSRPSLNMQFPPDIETGFKAAYRSGQKHHLLHTCKLELITLGLLAICDYFLLPGHYQMAWAMRFLWAIPFVVLVIHSIQHEYAKHHQHELIAILQTLLACGLATLTATLTPTDNHDYLFLQWLLLILGGNLLLPICFHIAAPLSLVMLLIHGTATWAQEAPKAGAFNATLTLATLVLITLETKRRTERDLRNTYARDILQSMSQCRLEEINKKLACQASRDGLTGVYNRRALDRAYSRLWRHAVREKRPISVLFIDVDYFKRYNDTYGHAAGDNCLIWLADLLQNAAKRPLDLVARFGGEEFVVILPDTRPEHAGIFAEKLRTCVLSSQHPHQASPNGRLTISIGSAGGIPDFTDKETLYLEQADQALYAAKAQGRNRVGHYLPELFIE